MADAKEISEKVMKALEDYLPVEGCGTFYSQHIEPVIKEALEEQRNRDHMPGGPCCAALDRRAREVYEVAARVVDDHESGKELCAEGVAERIRKLGNRIGK